MHISTHGINITALSFNQPVLKHVWVNQLIFSSILSLNKCIDIIDKLLHMITLAYIN